MKIVIDLGVALALVGCSTVSGVGKDITGAAEWTKEMMK